MNKVYGAAARQDGLYQIGRSKWELIYGYGEDGGNGYNYRQRFTRKPTAEELRQVLIDTINAETDAKILGGYEYDGVRVWLSSENQFNYKAAYDLAVQSGGSNLPVKFKLGEDGEGNAVYHTFSDMDDFTAFYVGAVSHINNTLSEGWAEKDGLDITAIMGV